MPKPLITAHEWGLVNLPVRYDTSRIRARIFNTGRFPSGEMFRLRGNRIYARDLVGFIDAGALQIQVLPKIYSGAEDLTDAAVLLRMLSTFVPIFSAELVPASTAEDSVDVLDAVLSAIATGLYRLLCRGLPRRFVASFDYAQTVRGRIDFAQLARRRAGSDQWIPSHYGVLQTNNALAMVVRALLERLIGTSRRHVTTTLLRNCLALVEGVTRAPLTSDLIRSVHLSRLEPDWRWPLALARTIASRQATDPFRAGDIPAFALVFPLDQLFEALVRQSCTRALARSGVAVRQSLTVGNLLRWPDGIETLALRPDLVVTNDKGNAVVIGDAKWKRLERDQVGLGLLRSDIYQIVAYLVRAKCERAVLFFPSAERLSDSIRIHIADVLPAPMRLAVVELDVARFATHDTAQRKSSLAGLRNFISHFVSSFATSASQ